MVMKVRIVIKSFNELKVREAAFILQSGLGKKKFKILQNFFLPCKKKKFCVIRSPHVNKDSREQYEINFYKQVIDILVKSMQNVDSLLYLKCPSGVIYTLTIL